MDRRKPAQTGYFQYPRKFYLKFLDQAQTKPFTEELRSRVREMRPERFRRQRARNLMQISCISDNYRILKRFNQGVKKSAEIDSASLIDVILQPNYTSEIVITVRPYSENSKVLYTNNPLILRRAHILLVK